MDIRFHELPWIHLIWITPVLGCLFLFGFHRRKVALEVFARSELLSHLVASVDRGKQYTRAILILVATAMLALSLARPQWGHEVQDIRRRGIDLVVLLDLSKSMLAADVEPSRLARAKIDLQELLQILRGDRIGLVGFAGRAEIRCPLTFDYGFFHHALSNLEVGSVGLGGTSIGDAIHKGLECFQDEFPNHKALLLITDGEDHAEFVKDAVEKARQRNVRVFSVGIGDSGEGRRIPVRDEYGNITYLEHDGQQVWSKMNPMLLQLAAVETGGTYVDAGTKSINLAAIYDEHISIIEKRELEGTKEQRYKDRFQWFLGFGLFLLLIEPLFTTRKRETHEH